MGRFPSAVFRRTRAAGAISAAALAMLAAACTPAPSPALAPYASATLTADSLGDLQLGRSTLGEVLRRLPPDTVDGVASDYPGLELHYAGRDLSLLFVIDAGPCWLALRTFPLREAAADVPALLAKEPACADVPLRSLAVRGGFWRGATTRGVQLGDPLPEALLHGLPRTDAPGYLHAGLYGAPAVRLDFPDGLAVFADSTLASDGPPIRMLAITPPDAR